MSYNPHVDYQKTANRVAYNWMFWIAVVVFVGYGFTSIDNGDILNAAGFFGIAVLMLFLKFRNKANIANNDEQINVAMFAANQHVKGDFHSEQHHLRCGNCDSITPLGAFGKKRMYQGARLEGGSPGIIHKKTGMGFSTWECSECGSHNAVAYTMFRTGNKNLEAVHGSQQ